MEDEKGRIEGQNERNDKEEVFTKVVRAGKRTYFFDVKSTRHEDLYLTITESKKRLGKRERCFMKSIRSFSTRRTLKSSPKGLREAVTFAGNGEVCAYRAQESLKRLKRPLPQCLPANSPMLILMNWGQGRSSWLLLNVNPHIKWIISC
ncbi:MAG: PUR family DNA/RNA-binding protein [Marinilabiliales bacterium]|nr:PUR family DNA/RNA-binding protein [Marinilabiliales bacterium]